MKDFIALEDQALLSAHGLNNFEALWQLKLEAVDEPNTERGGWSSVYRLELPGQAYYLKRQSNYLTRSLRHPLGEPTFAREFRNIQRYAQWGIPALQAAFFAQRKVAGEWRALLLTRALDGWRDLASWQSGWSELEPAQRGAIVQACGLLARQLHAAGRIHGCFYPKHIFLRAEGDRYLAQLIDLEKTRGLLLGDRDRVKDLEPLLRRIKCWNEADVKVFLQAYLGPEGDLALWQKRLGQRQLRKERS